MYIFEKGKMLELVSPYTAKQFGRALVMPNTTPEIFMIDDAENYYHEIKRATDPISPNFQPLMSLYFSKKITATVAVEIKESPYVYAVKLYLKGVTTNSEKGINDLKTIYKICESLQKNDIPLLIHGEIPDERIDIFDREKAFVDTILEPLQRNFPALRIVMEHITTAYSAQYVWDASSTLGATITPHHLLIDRNTLLSGGIKPHYYCLPILKRKEDKNELIRVATSGNKKFFAGTDSAPHRVSNKENACGCAGIFSAYNAVELYAHVFENRKSLNTLEAFLSENGANFYGIPKNKTTITLEKTEKQNETPEKISLKKEEVTLFKIKEPLSWKIQEK